MMKPDYFSKQPSSDDLMFVACTMLSEVVYQLERIANALGADDEEGLLDTPADIDVLSAIQAAAKKIMGKKAKE